MVTKLTHFELTVKEYWLIRIVHKVSHNKNIRSTFDVNLRSHQLFGSNDFNFKKDFNNQVFEIKYNKIYDNYVKNNLKDISFRMSKSSKYIISALNVPISFS